MQFIQKRIDYTKKRPYQLPIKPVGTFEFKGYHYPITMQPRAITVDPNTQESAIEAMQQFLKAHASGLGDIHKGNIGKIDISGIEKPIGIDLAPMDES